MDTDLAAHQVGQLLAYGEAETGAAVLSGGERVGLAEGSEYMGLRLLGYANACIDDLKAQQTILADCPDPHDDFAGVRELDGVADKVDQDLPQTHGIAAHRAGYVEFDGACEFQAFRMGPSGEDLDSFFHGFAQAEFDALEFEFARLDFREIQDIVDDLQQRFGGMRNGFREVPLACSEFGPLQEFRHAHDAVHRRTNFVTHTRKKLAFGAAGPLRRLLGSICFADCKLEVQVGIAQIYRALLDLLLEELAVLLQPRVAMPNLPEHLIEAVDERADFIVRTTFDAQTVVFFQGYPLHGVRQIDDGSRDLLLQPCGKPVRRQHCGRDRRQRDEEVTGPIRIQHRERHLYVDEPQYLIVAHDGRDDVEFASLQEQPRMLRIDGGCRMRDCKGVLRGRRFQVRIALATAVGGELLAV